jgi:hypothetical protein
VAFQQLRLITRGRGGYIFNFGQAPDGEADDLNHSESEFVAQTVNKAKIGVRESNRGGLQFVVRHCCHFYNTTNLRVLAKEQSTTQKTAKRCLQGIALRNIFLKHSPFATNMA